MGPQLESIDSVGSSEHIWFLLDAYYVIKVFTVIVPTQYNNPANLWSWVMCSPITDQAFISISNSLQFLKLPALNKADLYLQ